MPALAIAGRIASRDPMDERAFQKIVLKRQLSDLRVRGF
jgi:hypothetical protein